MHRIHRRLHHQVRWQVYVRVLPVVFLSVMIVGAFGWVVFTRYATDRLMEHDREEVAFLTASLRQQALVETMDLAVRRAALGAGNSRPAPGGDWAADLLRDPCLLAVATVGAGSHAGPDTTAPLLSGLTISNSLSGPVNTSRLVTWFENNRDHFAPGPGAPGSSEGWDPMAPVLADSNAWYQTLIFPPLLIEDSRGGFQASAGDDLAALLPVLVWDQQNSWTRLHTIYFLSLNHMTENLMGDQDPVAAKNSWWCVINHQGRVVESAAGVPTTGSLLRNQHRSHAKGPFSVVSGADLMGQWRMGQPWHHEFYGSYLSPWVITAGQTTALPLTILVGHQATDLGATNLGYISAVLGVALLALALALLGVTRVVGSISDRVTMLAHSLKRVAEGDYSHRIPVNGKDEIGRLIGYFNRMARSLDEAQQALTEKTARLESALETRRLLDRAKDDFLVLISHEVRTPLTAIMGGVNILKSQVQRAAGPDREVLDKLNLTEVVGIIESSGDRLHGFMDDAIQMTSIQSSDQELKLSPTPVATLIELGLCGVRELAQERGIDVVNGLDSAQPWQVLCDPEVLKLALARILKNAVEHNYEKGRVVIREVEEVPGQGPVGELTRANDVHRLRSLPAFAPFADVPLTWRLIEIFNTGEAIPAERCDALFGKFELVGRIEHHQRGSGLSLPIALSAVEHHGGRICVHSAKLQGNSFFLLLPTVMVADLAGLKHARNRKLGAVPEQSRDGIGRGSAHEDVDQVADSAGLEVEFDHEGAGAAGDGHQAGGGLDHAGGADDRQDIAPGGRGG